ncbi:MAG: glycosyltransferase family 4 protein [Bacteroidia bacterium]
MRILLLTDGIYPYTPGGMAKHSYYLAKYLSLSGQQVHLIHCGPENGLGEEKENIDFQDFNHNNITFQFIPFPAGDAFPGHYVRANKRYSQDILEVIKNTLPAFDLIYAQGFTGYAFLREGINRQIPLITNLHGYEMFQQPPSFRVRLEHQLIRPIARYVSLNSNFIFSFGGKITDLLLKAGIKENQILESPIGIESDWLVDQPSPSAKRRRFIFTGRYERRKGVQELTAALKQLLQEPGLPEFEFHFIGPIPAEHRISHPNIFYHGELRQAEKVKAILKTGDIFVCPSHSEGMPTVNMEAMACGLALLLTDVGAVSRQFADNGWLLARPEVGLLKNALREAIMLSPEEINTFKQRSLAHVRRHFIWSEVVKHKITLFDRALAQFHSTAVH